MRTIKHQEDESEVVPVHAMKAYVEREEKLHSFLTLAADGDKWLAVPTVSVPIMQGWGQQSVWTLLLLLRIKPQSLHCPTCGIVTILTELSWLKH